MSIFVPNRMKFSRLGTKISGAEQDPLAEPFRLVLDVVGQLLDPAISESRVQDGGQRLSPTFGLSLSVMADACRACRLLPRPFSAQINISGRGLQIKVESEEMEIFFCSAAARPVDPGAESGGVKARKQGQ